MYMYVLRNNGAIAPFKMQILLVRGELYPFAIDESGNISRNNDVR